MAAQAKLSIRQQAFSSTTLFLGVDLGVGGAFSVVNAGGELLSVADMPCLDDGPKGRRTINAALLAQLIAETHATDAFIEGIGPRPGEGVVQSFSFGRCKGLLEGILATLSIPARFIAPPVWKRIIGIAPGKVGTKDAARSEAIRRWPQHAALFARVRDADRAESALVAIAGISLHENPGRAGTSRAATALPQET